MPEPPYTTNDQGRCIACNRDIRGGQQHLSMCPILRQAVAETIRAASAPPVPCPRCGSPFTAQGSCSRQGCQGGWGERVGPPPAERARKRKAGA